jgi:hypothetical protein
MQIIQLDGIYTYLNNVKDLKLNEKVKLIINKNNRINPNAIGVYTLNHKKLGYIPYTINQINIDNIYKISKINLNKNNLQVLINCDTDLLNYIKFEPEYIKNLKYNSNIIKSEIDSELIKFQKYLKQNKIQIKNLGITYIDDNFINISLDDNIFYTVTKKYYDENVFKYDDFFENKLIPLQIYELFKIHRLEIYIKKNYKTIEEKIKSKNIKLKILEEFNINMNKISLDSNNCINDNNLIFNTKISILEAINSSMVGNISYQTININNLLNHYINISEGGIFYNHQLKTYCEIDFFNSDTIIEINSFSENTNKIKKYILILLVKLAIADKNKIDIFNPEDNSIISIEIISEVKSRLFKLLN